MRLRQALCAGLTHERFWNLTPAECYEFVVAWQDRQKIEHERAMQAAWLGARLERARHIPATFAELLRGGRTNRKLEGEELERARAQHDDIVRRERELRGRLQCRKA